MGQYKYLGRKCSVIQVTGVRCRGRTSAHLPSSSITHLFHPSLYISVLTFPAKMIRASQFPPVASPALCALRLSLLPALTLTPPSHFRTYATFNFPPALIRRLRLSNSLYFAPSTFNRVAPSIQTHPFLRGTVSFAMSSTSGGGYGREILVQHLLVKADEPNLLVELQKRAVGGEDLSDLALEYSTCPSKEQGGMLGWVRKGQMVPEFEEAAFSAPLNKIVRCKTKFGWHLLQVLSEREELSLQDIQPDELYAKLQDSTFLEEAQLIDVREPDEVAQASLPNFEVFPLRQFGTWAPEMTTKFNPDKETYVMCHHGMRSLQVAKWLQSQGFKKIYNVAGGIHAYAVKADPSVPTY